MDLELATTETPRLEVGARGPDFSLQATDDKRYTLSSFNARFLVIIFISNGCPTVRAYEERLITLQRTYGPRGTQLIGINSNNDHLSAIDAFDEMVKRAKESRFNFPYLKDTDARVANRYGAICTPHTFLLDDKRILRYKGRIDDARHESRVTSPDLKNALDTLLGGEAVKVSETEPFGCSIVW